MPATLVDDIATANAVVLEPITVDQYHAMLEQGILREGAPIELIDGLLVRKDRRDGGGDIMTVGIGHASTVNELSDLLYEVIRGSGYHRRTQQPTTLSRTDEPEPDITVASGANSDYKVHHPGPAEISLIVEVADSSLRHDRTTKMRLYSAAGIPVYWIVNLTENVIEVYERPQPEQKTYASRLTYAAGDELAFELGGRQFAIRVDDVL